MKEITMLKKLVRNFLGKYLEVRPDDEKVIASYVLRTWEPLWDGATYLMFVGGPGTGKSRAGVLMRALCKNPLVAYGYSQSALLATLDKMHPCTLILDFDAPGDKDVYERILETGRRKETGLVMIRGGQSMAIRTFGYKVILAEKVFENLAIQSNCITIQMRGRLTGVAPRSLFQDFDQAAGGIREQLKAHFAEAQSS